MPSASDTAYPLLKAEPTDKELTEIYTPRRDFDPDPTAAADSQREEDAVLASLGYIRK